MMGMGTPKMDGSVEPKSCLVRHEGETRDKASSHTLHQFSNGRNATTSMLSFTVILGQCVGVEMIETV